MKVTPYKVSILVVKAVKSSSLLRENFISDPNDLPIQFFCIAFTFSGQSRLSTDESNSSA